MNTERLKYIKEMMRWDRIIYEGPPSDKFIVFSQGEEVVLDRSATIGTINFLEFMSQFKEFE